MKSILVVFVVGQLLAVQQPCGNTDERPYGGYDWYGSCVPGYISEATWFTRAPLYSTGDAVYYGPNVMEGTARFRRLPLDDYLDGVALMSPADLGRTVWIKRQDRAWEGPYLSVDVAQRDDMYGIIASRGEVIEVGFQTALRWGLVREIEGGWRANAWKEVGVEVWIGDVLPRWLTDQVFGENVGAPTPEPYRDWFLRNVTFVNALADNDWPVVAKPGQCWLFRDPEPDRLKCPEDWPAEPLNWTTEDIEQ